MLAMWIYNTQLPFSSVGTVKEQLDIWAVTISFYVSVTACDFTDGG